MSVIEEIVFFHRFDPQTYLEILKSERNATVHPSQPGAYMVEDLPFYSPKLEDEYVFVLGFNHTPLSGALVEALANHPELVPDEVEVKWMVEQDEFLTTTMAQVREKLASQTDSASYKT